MQSEAGKFFVPEAATPTIDTTSRDRIRAIVPEEHYDITELRRNMWGIADASAMSEGEISNYAEFIEEVVKGCDDPEVFVVCSFFNRNDVAVSGIGVGRKTEDGQLELNGLVLNPARQGSGKRALGIIEEMARVSQSQKVYINVSENDRRFFQELFGEAGALIDEEGEDRFLFIADTSRLE